MHFKDISDIPNHWSRNGMTITWTWIWEKSGVGKRTYSTVSICIPQRCFLKHVSRISGNSANVSASPLAQKVFGHMLSAARSTLELAMKKNRWLVGLGNFYLFRWSLKVVFFGCPNQPAYRCMFLFGIFLLDGLLILFLNCWQHLTTYKFIPGVNTMCLPFFLHQKTDTNLRS